MASLLALLISLSFANSNPCFQPADQVLKVCKRFKVTNECKDIVPKDAANLTAAEQAAREKFLACKNTIVSEKEVCHDVRKTQVSTCEAALDSANKKLEQTKQQIAEVSTELSELEATKKKEQAKAQQLTEEMQHLQDYVNTAQTGFDTSHVNAQMRLNQATQERERATQAFMDAAAAIQQLLSRRQSLQDDRTSDERRVTQVEQSREFADRQYQEAINEMNQIEQAADRGRQDVDQRRRARGLEGDGGGSGSTPRDPGATAGGPGKKDEGNAGQGNNAGQGGGGGGAPPSSPRQDPVQVSQPAQDCSNPSFAASNPVCACRLNPERPGCSQVLAADPSVAARKAPQMLAGQETGGGGGFSTGPGRTDGPKNIPGYGQYNVQGQSGNAPSGAGGSAARKPTDADDPKSANARDALKGPKRGSGFVGGGGGTPGLTTAALRNPQYANLPQLPRAVQKRLAAAALGKKENQVTEAELKAYMSAQLRAIQRGPAGIGRAEMVSEISGPHTSNWRKTRQRYQELLD